MSAKNQQTEQDIDYVAVAQSEEFQSFMTKRKKFVIPYTIFFLVFYFLLPICTSYTTFLNQSAIGDISWVWLFAFAQFIMTFVLCIVYVKKAGQFDEESDQIIKAQLKEGGKAS